MILMNNKNLASIQRIKKIEKHPDADRLVVLSVLGWQCVTNYQHYTEGDLCVYIQIDTTVPKTPWSEFLFKKDTDRARISTAKLRGLVSQGLCLPLHEVLPGWETDIGGNITYNNNGVTTIANEGQDVSELLDVQKYEKPAPTSQDAIGHFPTSLVAKTDEERIQNSLRVLDELRGKQAYITKKMDGTSATFIKQYGMLRVCSRNQELKDGNNHYWNMARKYDLEAEMENDDVIQAEIIGPGIQGNKSGEKEVTMKVFNLGTTNGRKYDNMTELVGYCADLDLPMVPIISMIDEFDETLESLLELADATKYDNGAQCEGIVIRPVEETFSSTLQGRLSFKVISPKFAVKHKE